MPKGGGFVMSSKQADELIKLADGDVAKLENYQDLTESIWERIQYEWI